MLIILRLLRFIFPLLAGYLFLRAISGMLYGRTYQRGGRQEGPSSGGGSRTPPPYGRSRHMDPYEVLGCSPRDPDEKIKKAHRKLVAKYHPDRFIGLELDKDFTDLAAIKFQEIQEAYEQIRRSRGFA